MRSSNDLFLGTLPESVRILILEKRRLALVKEVSDPKAYALEWYELHKKFAAENCRMNSALCLNNAKHWSSEYLDIHIVPEPEVPEPQEAPYNYTDF